MQAYRKSRVVGTLTRIISIAYFGLGAGAAIVLIGVPVVKLLAPERPARIGDFRYDPDWTFGLPVPVAVTDSAATVSTRWGPAQLSLEDVRGSVELPILRLPWWLVAVLWTHTAVFFALMLLSLHNLRRIFQRVRDGAPFDAQNALRLRWVGLLLLTYALFNGVAQHVTAQAVRRGLPSSIIAVRTGFYFDLPLVFVSLALIALAEIFRRGTELEAEQSLVI